MGAAKELIGVPAPFQLEAKPRLCGKCGKPKMTGRAANARVCLDCSAGTRDLPKRLRTSGIRSPRLPVAP